MHIKQSVILFWTIFWTLPLSAAPIRTPAVAGKFYPGKKLTLKANINAYIAKAHPISVKKPLFALIVPHAGYIYSGPVAGYAYQLLKQQQQPIDTIVILGVNHHFPGLKQNSVYNGDAYLTPLGQLPINKEIVARLLTYPEIIFEEKAHLQEHSIEVQIPFLQTINHFRIVPLIIGDYSLTNCEKVANILIKEVIQKFPNSLILASTDLSHFHEYNIAKQKDLTALRHITDLDTDAFISDYASKKIELCGFGPALVTMLMAQKCGFTQNLLLKYLNSGDTAGDKKSVVGYGAVAFFKPSNSNHKESIPMTKKETYSEKDKKFLLDVARQTLISYVKEKEIPSFDPPSELFLEKRGAFVTLHKKGMLRGCIGYIEPIKPLLQTIIDNAINASSNDSRFPKVTPNELNDIDIEISILSVPEKINSYKDIVIGKHGVILQKRFHKAVFLPQVAPEQGWDVFDTLENLCYKAGLSPNDWKEGTELFTFTATVFGENDK